jgi:DNA polymerase-3 subunit gamma/tau
MDRNSKTIMTQALYRKWRPQKWDEVVSQEHVVTTLKNAVTSDRVAHAYLFAGPRGTGKTTAARLLAKAVNCLAENRAERPCNQCAHCTAVNENRFLDLIEIDAASNTSVEDVRNLRDKINFSPSQGKYKIYIIDEVHMLSTAAFNALLKTLEEPPPHAIFILATTEIHKIPATVLSRCQRHEFRRVPVGEITRQLEGICKSEGIVFDPDALTAIARQSAGGMRDAISLLDQLASTGERVTIELTQSVLGTATGATVLGLVDAVQNADPAKGLESIHAALDAGADPRSLARQIVDYLRAVLLVQMGNSSQVEAPAEVRARMKTHAEAFTSSQVLRMMKAFNAAATDLRGGWQPALSLELAFAEVLEPAALAAATPTSAQTPSSKQSSAPTKKETPLYQQQPAVASKPDSTPKANQTKSPTSSAASGVTIEQVNQVWRQMIASIKQQKNNQLEALLNSTRSREMTDGVLVLGFASDVLKSKMDHPEMLEATRLALREFLGTDVPVRTIVVNPGGKTTPNEVSPGGMVAAALENGGEIVDIQ